MSSLEPLCNFRRNPCSLELTASVASAAVLCRRAAMMNPTNPPGKVQEIIALPSAIERKIQRFMPIVKEQIASWSDFYNREIFFDQQYCGAHEYFHVLVWSADGTINEKETAREMLKQDGLNAVKKYRVACNHCLENEIRALWSNLKKMYWRKKERYYDEHPLVYYWEWVRSDGGTTGGMNVYIIYQVFESKYNYSACVTDYFLNKFFDSHNRIDAIPSSCLQKMSFRSWENFLMKLSNEQLTGLRLVPYSSYSVMWKLDDLMRFWMHADFVVQIWIRIRDEYPDDEFSDLIEELLKYEKSEFRSADHISLAVEIFNLAPYEMQKRVFDDYNMRDWWNRDSNLTDVRLDVAILSTTDPDCKLYRNYSPPNQLVDFIEESFDNIRLANEFKMGVLSSVDCLEACYEDAGNDMFDWLKDAVWMCSCNDDDFNLYKSMFLHLGVELAKASKCDIPDVFRDPGWKSFLEWCSDES